MAGSAQLPSRGRKLSFRQVSNSRPSASNQNRIFTGAHKPVLLTPDQPPDPASNTTEEEIFRETRGMYRPNYAFDSSITARRGVSLFAGPIAASALFASLALFAVGCDTKSAPITKPPAPQVTVAKVECKPVIETDEFTGCLDAVDPADGHPPGSRRL